MTLAREFQSIGRALRRPSEGAAILHDWTLERHNMGKSSPKELSDAEVRTAEHALRSAKVRNALMAECVAIEREGNRELSEALSKCVRALTYDQLARMRRAILGA